MRNRSRSPQKESMKSLDYTTVPTEVNDNFPSSFHKESKSLPCLRSYLCRRRLNLTAGIGMFVGIGVLVGVVKMKGQGRFGTMTSFDFHYLGITMSWICVYIFLVALILEWE